MLRKEQVLKSIKELPDQFTIDELIDRVILLNKIDKGVEQSDRQETKSTKEAVEHLKKWLK
jgi:phage-related protein